MRIVVLDYVHMWKVVGCDLLSVDAFGRASVRVREVASAATSKTAHFRTTLEGGGQSQVFSTVVDGPARPPYTHTT